MEGKAEPVLEEYMPESEKEQEHIRHLGVPLRGPPATSAPTK
jgi:hypothetical protein